MKGIVNKIIPFSNVDGPGNRLSIFFQGCNFDCLYCHNPETIEIMKEGNCSDDVTTMTVEEIMNEISEVASFISGITVFNRTFYSSEGEMAEIDLFCGQ